MDVWSTDLQADRTQLVVDLGSSSLYAAVADYIVALLASAAVDAHEVDEIVYIGGTACLPELDERICLGAGSNEEIETPFSRGTVVGGGVGDPTIILAPGWTALAALLSSISEDAELRDKGHQGQPPENHNADAGGSLPDPAAERFDNKPRGIQVPVVQKETALPMRRTVSFDVGLTEESTRFALEVYEVKDAIRVEKVHPPKAEADGNNEEEEEEEEEEIEVKHKTVTYRILITDL